MKPLRDKCGVLGILRHEKAAELTYFGLYALQHRGQESAGIATDAGRGLRVETGMGYVVDVFRAEKKNLPRGDIAIGHVRYSTAGESAAVNAQPILFNTRYGEMAICHNGNLVDYAKQREALERDGAPFATTSDTEVILHLIARSGAPRVEDAVVDALSQVRGAYTLLFLLPGRVVGVRDVRGFRPLVLGKLGEAHVLASETCALDLIRAQFVREVEPGEMVTLSDRGVESRFPFERAEPRQCVFELIYFARPDSRIFNRDTYRVRFEMGRQMAREHPVEADLVVPVPDSGLVAALGYTEEAGIPFAHGLTRNHYVGRTFIQPKQEGRDMGVRVKLNPVSAVLRGKRIVLVDDSIVRGTTCKKIVSMVREGGASEVHMRISCPPYVSPCLYGIDTPTEEELIANRMGIDGIRSEIGADTLGYLSLEGLQHAVEADNQFCYACFTKEYPIPRPAKEPPQPGLFER
jgi:amidophosphoribosyltransferase